MDPEYISFISKCFISSSKKLILEFIIIIIFSTNKFINCNINNLNVIDSTILGMNRVAGITPTEALLLELGHWDININPHIYKIFWVIYCSSK